VQVCAPVKACVFCPPADKSAGREILTVKNAKSKSWQIKVIANKFPALSPKNKNAYGYQEVVIESPQHEIDLADLPLGHIVKLFEVYAERTKKLSQDKKISYIEIFKNKGREAGASLAHSHSQIFASQFLTPMVKSETEQAVKYRLEHDSCPYCDIVKKEKNSQRLVWQDNNFMAFCPWASQHPYEIWLMSKRHIDNIGLLKKTELVSLATMLKKALTKINSLGLAYNYFFHQIIRDPDQHFCLKIVPRQGPWVAGMEIGFGLYINSLSPEEATKFYKK